MSYINISEVAKRLNITTRSVQRRCAKEGIEKRKGVYLITEKLFKNWILSTPRRDTPQQRNVVSKKKPVSKENTYPYVDDSTGRVIDSFSKDQYDKIEAQVINNAVLKERSEQQQDHIHTLKDNLNLANNRIKLLEQRSDNQLDKVLTGLNNTLSILSEENHLKFIAASEIKPKE